MITIQIVTNPDRCHVSEDGRPVVTYMYSDYELNHPDREEEYALNDAKIFCFNRLADYHVSNQKAQLNTIIAKK